MQHSDDQIQRKIDVARFGEHVGYRVNAGHFTRCSKGHGYFTPAWLNGTWRCPECGESYDRTSNTETVRQRPL